MTYLVLFNRRIFGLPINPNSLPIILSENSSKGLFHVNLHNKF